jgi:hypothetical protein
MGRWRFELATEGGSKPSSVVPKPFCFQSEYRTDENIVAATVSPQQEKAMKEQEAYRVAVSPGTGLFTTAFMLWMSGSTLQIFSIMMIGMAFVNPVKAIAGVNDTFSRFEQGEHPISLKLPKLIFLLIQILALCLAAYKVIVEA